MGSSDLLLRKETNKNFHKCWAWVLQIFVFKGIPQCNAPHLAELEL